jgi:FlaA1/EpsC-like NDP-sugar epimerase
MTAQEAVELVLLAGAFDAVDGHQGSVFVLDMGQPVRIRDLAERMIHAAGYEVADPSQPDAAGIEIRVSQPRPGEKLHEELMIGEGFLKTPHPRILRASEAPMSEINVAYVLRDIRAAIKNQDHEAARKAVFEFVEHPIAAERDAGIA